MRRKRRGTKTGVTNLAATGREMRVRDAGDESNKNKHWFLVEVSMNGSFVCPNPSLAAQLATGTRTVGRSLQTTTSHRPVHTISILKGVVTQVKHWCCIANLTGEKRIHVGYSTQGGSRPPHSDLWLHTTWLVGESTTTNEKATGRTEEQCW